MSRPWTYQPRKAARARAAIGLLYVCGQSSKQPVWSKSVQRALCCCTAHVESASSTAELASSQDSSTRAERALLVVFCPSLAPQKTLFTQKRSAVVARATGSEVLQSGRTLTLEPSEVYTWCSERPQPRCRLATPRRAHKARWELRSGCATQSPRLF